MQKRSLKTLKNQTKYKSYFQPLPTDENNLIYFDKNPVPLPFFEDFPKLHYHDRYEIGICLDGNGLFLSEGVYASISKGDIIFVPKGDRHYSKSLDQHKACMCRFIYVKGDIFEKNNPLNLGVDFNKITQNLTPVPIVISNQKHKNAYELLFKIFSYDNNLFAQNTASVLFRFALFLIEAKENFPSVEQDYLKKDNKISEDVSLVAEYLYLHYNEPVSSKFLASLCFLSESQLRKKFIEAYGEPPIKYRNRMRTKIAIELLRKNELTISEISIKLGYASPSDFYRNFKNFYKISPQEYRKEYLKNT